MFYLPYSINNQSKTGIERAFEPTKSNKSLVFLYS